MKTPDEIKKAVSMCILSECCEACPYHEDVSCSTMLMLDVFACIEALEAEREGKTMKTPDEIKLKPCPFCGGEAEINVDHEEVEDTEKRHWAYTVVCNRCCATSGLTYLPEKAREAWNRRAEHE